MVRVGIVGIAILLLVLRILFTQNQSRRYAEGQEVKITALVSTEPIRIYQKLYIAVEGIAIEIPADLDLSYGDKIMAVGTLAKPLIAYRNVKFSLIDSKFVFLGHQPSLVGWARSVRDKLILKQRRWIPGDEGALAAGILIGGTGGMSYSLKNNFSRVGLTHVVAASGYNVTLLAGWTMLLFGRFVNKRLVILFSIVSIILYVLIAGATASVVRAGIMASTMWLGKLLGRESDSLWLLGLAAWIMLMINPNYLTDIGFQLSVAATTGILWLQPKNDWWTSIAAQVTTLPLILHHFGNLSVVAPVVNVVLLWMVAPLMQILALGLVIGPANYLAWPGLKLMTSVVNWVGAWSWSSWQIGNISWWWVVGYYVALLVIYELITLRAAFKRN